MSEAETIVKFRNTAPEVSKPNRYELISQIHI
jgi:hypothetical protein